MNERIRLILLGFLSVVITLLIIFIKPLLQIIFAILAIIIALQPNYITTHDPHVNTIARFNGPMMYISNVHGYYSIEENRINNSLICVGDINDSPSVDFVKMPYNSTSVPDGEHFTVTGVIVHTMSFDRSEYRTVILKDSRGATSTRDMKLVDGHGCPPLSPEHNALYIKSRTRPSVKIKLTEPRKYPGDWARNKRENEIVNVLKIIGGSHMVTDITSVDAATITATVDKDALVLLLTLRETAYAADLTDAEN